MKVIFSSGLMATPFNASEPATMLATTEPSAFGMSTPGCRLTWMLPLHREMSSQISLRLAPGVTEPWKPGTGGPSAAVIVTR